LNFEVILISNFTLIQTIYDNFRCHSDVDNWLYNYMHPKGKKLTPYFDVDLANVYIF